MVSKNIKMPSHNKEVEVKTETEAVIVGESVKPEVIDTPKIVETRPTHSPPLKVGVIYTGDPASTYLLHNQLKSRKNAEIIPISPVTQDGNQSRAIEYNLDQMKELGKAISADFEIIPIATCEKNEIEHIMLPSTSENHDEAILNQLQTDNPKINIQAPLKGLDLKEIAKLLKEVGIDIEKCYKEEKDKDKDKDKKPSK